MAEVICPDTGKASFDVGIVGFGPVGATVAALLARMGVSTVVVEKAADIYPLPRAVHFDDEAMRVFQAMGVADRIAKESIEPLRYPCAVSDLGDCSAPLDSKRNSQEREAQ